jgi:hypothetical protein
MKLPLLTVFIFFISYSYAQQEFTLTCVGFYNFENLFDTIDSPDTDDFEFTPQGPNLYNTGIYTDKLKNLSAVVSRLGKEYTPDGAALLGVSEIENRSVLEDFVRQPIIASRDYKILHRDSRDARGVDVALLYQQKYFTPDTVIYFPLITEDDGHTTRYSRDILIAIGDLVGERVAISVNHWPSRRGGENATAALRNAAAAINRKVLDSLYEHSGIRKAIVMGDLNDDPVNVSVRGFLKARRSKSKLDADEMYNPMEDFYRQGIGTTAYQDAWSLFDQIIVSAGLVMENSGWRFYKAGVFNPPFLVQKSGNFKGYPLRTYANGSYLGGYSDHFPVYILLLKEK